MSTDRVQAAWCLVKQFFDNYNHKPCSAANKQLLEGMHDRGRAKLNQILASSNELRLSNLSVEHLSPLEYHKRMCKTLECYFKGIDDMLPPPTIIQVYYQLSYSKS